MKKVLTAAQMKACDEAEISGGTPSEVLMERAAKEVYAALCREHFFDTSRTLFVCGGGNNGGDGLLCAIFAHRDGIDATVFFAGSEERCTPECARRLREAREAGVRFDTDPDFGAYTAIVDALFGIGLSKPAAGRYAQIINKINESEAKVLSVDIPSGVFADTGECGCAVRADETVAVAAYKFGNLYSGMRDKCSCVDIGIPTDADAPLALEVSDIVRLLGVRAADSHKGTYGRVLIIGGDSGMCGAAYLSALAAYRCGAGLVEILTHEDNRLALQTLIPEAIVTCVDFERPDIKKAAECIRRADSICIGMGLGTRAVQLVRLTFEAAKCPLCVDADALNLCARHGIEIPRGACVTPHPMELSRLTKIPVGELKGDLRRYASELARERGITVLAKDWRTVITDGETVYINASGSPALAKGGSGDVLAGIIGAYLCRDMNMLEAAALAAFVHGRAGEFCAEIYGENGALARDIANEAATVVNWAFQEIER